MRKRWPFRMFYPVEERPCFTDVEQYEQVYSATLHTTLDMVEQGLLTERLRRLSPVYLDPPDQGAVDILGMKHNPVYRDDLRIFAETQHQTRQAGVWSGFAELMTVQPALLLRVSRRVQEFALMHALISHDVKGYTLPAGAASVFFLIVLNNLLVLHHRVTTESAWKPSWRRRVFGRRKASDTGLKSQINLAFGKLQAYSKRLETGDAVFLHTAMPLLVQLAEYGHLSPYPHRLVRSSPLTIVTEITDSEIWSRVTAVDMEGIAPLIQDTCPFRFMDMVVRQWVEAIMTAEGEAQRQIFARIQRVIDNLCTAESPSSGARLLLRFARTLSRSWPDEQRQDELFGRSRDQAVVWHDLLTRLLSKVDTVLRSEYVTSTEGCRLSPEDHQMLRHAVVMAQRKMALAAS